MRSNTSNFSTRWIPRMMPLTLLWDIRQAMPIWVWLAPVYCCTKAKNRPMSRLRRAVMTSGRSQNEAGIRIRSSARPVRPWIQTTSRTPLPGSASGRALGTGTRTNCVTRGPR